MLTVQVDVRLVSSALTPVALVAQSSSTLLLEDCLKLVSGAANPWGVYLHPKDHASLNETLRLLNRLNSEKLLYFPVWISMEISYGSFSTPGYVKGEDFINSVNDIFPAVTIAPRWPPERLNNGYTDMMVQDMLKLFEEVWQDVSFQLQAVALGKAWLGTVRLLKASPTYTLTVEHTTDQGTFVEGYHGLMAIRTHTSNGVYYKLPPDYRTSLMTNIYST